MEKDLRSPQDQPSKDETAPTTKSFPRTPPCAELVTPKDPRQTARLAETVVLPQGTPAHAPASVPSIAGYEVLSVLGQGGMGVVYKARQLSLNRMVALKMLLDAASDPAALARFRVEAETIAQIQHPNIVQIYDVGEHQGRPFIALELVEGTSLAKALARSLFPFRETALLVATLAQAMHAAHQRGIIHRDLKPGNILFAVGNRPPALAGYAPLSPGRLGAESGALKTLPKITDFGLAKRLNAQEGPTVTGDLLGTPSYMSPEQATGDLSAIGPATDIYALGAILYEMLTGQPPFRGRTSAAILWEVIHEAPVQPSRLRAHVPRDLETICLTCLAKDPHARYASAEKLAEDLHAYLAGLPIQARPASRGKRLLRWLRSHPATALFAGVGLMALAGLFFGLWFRNPIAFGGLAVANLCIGAWWYSARLKRALGEVRQQNLFSQRSVERLHLLLETVNRLLATPDQDQRLRVLGEATAHIVNAERATIYLIDEAKGEIWSRMALGEELSVIRLPIGSGIAGEVAKTGDIINLSDPYNDSRFNPEIDRRTGFTTRNMLTLPMNDPNGRRMGVFQILNKRGGPFGSEDVEVLFHLAQSASLLVATPSTSN
ncbi:MAG: protein kinase [Planctomycetes bacterium]|nr:protein kinase [Planctomycetota bacterium]